MVDRMILAGVAGLGVYLLWCAFTIPNATGLFDDDAVYQVTAKSLADGHSYLRLDRPGEPHQTKYPPAYPLMLAPFWNLGGGYPGNIAWLRVPAVVAAVLGIWLGLRYAAKYLCLGSAGLIVLALMCLTLPEVRLFSMVTMSELPFAALTLASLILAERAAGDESMRRMGAAALAAGLAAGLAYLTRSVGITLIVAIIGWLLWKGRWLAAVLAAGPALICVAGWTIWTGWIAAHEAGIRKSDLLRYDLDYSAWLPHSLRDLLQVGWLNLCQFAFVDSQMLLRIPGTALSGFFQNGSNAALWHLLAWGLLLLVLVGFLFSARQRLSAGHVFMALYALVSLCWPFGPNRFIIPVFPLVAAFAIFGCGAVLGRLRLPRGLMRPVEFASAAIFGAATLGLNISGQAALFSVKDHAAHLGGGTFNLEALQTTADWLTRETPPDAIVACRRSSVTWLASGRKTVILMPYLDPVAYHYSGNRRFQDFYLKPARDEAEAARREGERLQGLYQELGVTHLIRTGEDEPLFSEAVEMFLRGHPEQFSVQWGQRALRVAVLRLLK